MLTAADQARRAADKADSALGAALLRIRDLVPKTEGFDKQFGRTFTAECPVWQNLYYGRTAKNVEKFRKELPAVAALIEGELNALVTTAQAKKEAVTAEKAEKAARKAERDARKTERDANPARPLASINPVAATNYDVLSKVFAKNRAEYVEAILEARIWAAACRVVANVNEEETRESAGADFDGYMGKLATKITSLISTGSLTGSLWSGSHLTVETVDGRQVWYTRSIINCSVNNNLFNQWPTRRVR